MDSAERTWTLSRADWLQFRADVATAVTVLADLGDVEHARRLRGWLLRLAESARYSGG